MSDARYTGTENLEVMKEAVNYNRALLGLVTTHARKGSRIVDFGAGVGTFAVAMQANGYAVACVELDAAQREIQARQDRARCGHDNKSRRRLRARCASHRARAAR